MLRILLAVVAILLAIAATLTFTAAYNTKESSVKRTNKYDTSTPAKPNQ